MLLVGMLNPLSIIHQCSSIEHDLMYTVGELVTVLLLPDRRKQEPGHGLETDGRLSSTSTNGHLVTSHKLGFIIIICYF